MKNLWDLRDEQGKKPRVALTLPGIVKAAIYVADTDGIDAVSMQRIAGDLGFTKMSLYRHVPGKAELLSLMIDTAVGEPPDLSSVPRDWRAPAGGVGPRPPRRRPAPPRVPAPPLRRP